MKPPKNQTDVAPEHKSGVVGSLSYLSQTLATTAGEPYVLSLWLNSPDGLGTNEFLVSWNGATLYNQTNLPALGWTHLQCTVWATGTNTLLESDSGMTQVSSGWTTSVFTPRASESPA